MATTRTVRGRRPRRAPGTLLVLLSAVAIATACSASPRGTPGSPSTAPDPVARLGACDPPPAAVEVDLPDAALALLPVDAVLTSATTDGPVTQFAGWVGATPIDVRRTYEQRRADVALLGTEDEIVEAEVLIGDGSRRAYVVVTAVCDAASRFEGIIGPEVAGSVPDLRGGTPTS